jgi:hypothetical protein
MNLQIEIETKSKKRLLQELKDMIPQIEMELKDPICKNCKSCKDKNKGCVTGGGSSDYSPKLESTWNLRRKHGEHKAICKSKQKN